MLIGLVGRKFSGKDTLGLYLIKKYSFTRLAFADSLKNACKIIFGFSDSQINGDLKETIDPFWGHTPREILQKVGTDLFRNKLSDLCKNISSDIWIKNIERQLESIDTTNIVITDVRFPNEVDFIKKHGGITIKITRPNLIHNFEHSSENQIDEMVCDYEIINDSTILNLYTKFEELSIME